MHATLMRSLLTLLLAALPLASVADRPAATSADAAPGAEGNGSDARGVARPLLTDDALLEKVQRETFRYFWDFAAPGSGLARERSNRTDYGPEVATIGGTGFGVITIVIASARGWITRAEAIGRLDTLTAFLARADRFHGVYPHWMDGATGRVIPFGEDDDGGDIVETAYLFEGLLTARQYFDRDDPAERALRARIDSLWRDVDWTAHVPPNGRALMWNRSPRTGFSVGAEVAGWNEALITYVLAASSPTHPIDPAIYHQGWARDGKMRNGRSYEGIVLPLGPKYGGPLFFEHFSFVALDPRGLKDRYADYGEQCVNHTRIQRQYCVRNPHRWRGYGPGAWGLTSCDVPGGYDGHSPTEDTGVIAPTAALSSFPYTPEWSMQALRHYHDDLGATLFGDYGFADAFEPATGWVAPSRLAIDQGPIVIMIENHRTGLPWKLFMSCPEVQAGLRRLGFTSPHLP